MNYNTNPRRLNWQSKRGKCICDQMDCKITNITAIPINDEDVNFTELDGKRWYPSNISFTSDQLDNEDSRENLRMFWEMVAKADIEIIELKD